MELIDDTIDFNEYLKTPPEAAKIKLAESWRDEVVDRFFNPELRGCCLPWSKTHNLFRIRPGELTIWSGYNSAGKSLILNQVILSLLTQGEKACIASMEMKPASTIQRMVRQAAGTPEPTIRFIDGFSRWTNKKLWLYDQTGTVKHDRIIAILRYCETLGITQFVIDSLMKCGVRTDDYNLQKDFVDQLCAHAKDTGMHIHLVAHARKGETEQQKIDKMSIKGASEITDQADNTMLLMRNKRKEEEATKPNPKQEIMDQPDAILKCDKQRHGDHEPRIALYFHQKSTQYLSHQNSPLYEYVDHEYYRD